jgi:hypothetical protein
MPVAERKKEMAGRLWDIQYEYQYTKNLTESQIIPLADLQEKLDEQSRKLRHFDEIEFVDREFTEFLLKNNIQIESFLFEDLSEASDNFTALTPLRLTIEGKAQSLETMMMLPDYVNDVYSYRLVEMEIKAGEPASHDVIYVVEMIMRNWA